jgi:hypothetical protein
MDGAPLRKMVAERSADGSVRYALQIGIDRVPLDARIGGALNIHFTGARTCMACGKRVRKFYGQGFCYPCLRDAPEASACIVRPELCRAHLGEGRDVQWERDHHHQEHFVYLAQTGPTSGGPEKGGIKVGVTRSTQVPVRWMDQGAVAAVLIARVPYRQLAGAIEVDLKRIFPDRTDWRAMLRQLPADHVGVEQARTRALGAVDPALGGYMLEEEPVMGFHYPGGPFPPRVASVSLEKAPELNGNLVGVKGQYLVFGDGRVLNIRNHSGFHVDVGILTAAM